MKLKMSQFFFTCVLLMLICTACTKLPGPNQAAAGMLPGNQTNSGVSASNPALPETAIGEQQEYQEILLPGPDEIRIELPLAWSHYGNGMYFSPDEGETLFGIRQAWLESGRDVIADLMPVHYELLTEEPVLVRDQQQANFFRMQVFAYDKNNPEQKGALSGFAAMYALPSPDRKQMLGFYLENAEEAGLLAQEETLRHIVETYQWGAASEVPESGYVTVSEPGPEGIQYEMPYDWAHWGNAGYYSPDDGKTLIGLRRAWIEEGKNVDLLMVMGESSVVQSEAVAINGTAVTRYLLEVQDTLHTQDSACLEVLYAFDAPDGEQRIGLALHATDMTTLLGYEEVLMHMLGSLTWKPAP